jgi:hypothetical protein
VCGGVMPLKYGTLIFRDRFWFFLDCCFYWVSESRITRIARINTDSEFLGREVAFYGFLVLFVISERDRARPVST